MPLDDALKGVRLLETLENYARADVNAEQVADGAHGEGGLGLYADEHFWSEVMRAPEEAWGRTCHVYRAAVSEWIPRVPGLFWAAESKALRTVDRAKLESVDLGGPTYTPPGKSEIVMGGVGTLKLPPTPDGYRLITLTPGVNASSGVPALVSPEVWDASGLKEGVVVEHAEAPWRRMDLGWAARFPSLRGIPRGYLVLDDPGRIEVVAAAVPVQIHPFTIMSYDAGAAELWDFVFATANAQDPRHRDELATFFADYRRREDRAGRYLFAADVADPLWDAEFVSPADLRRAEPGAASQLELIEKRVRDRLLGRDTVEGLVRALAELEGADLRRFSADIGLPASRWDTGASVAESSAQLVNAADERGKLEELLEAYAIEYPGRLSA